MNPLIANLAAQGTVLTDGAWGTQLQARGLAGGDFPDAWNLSRPEDVLAVAQAYLQAGSQIILTNTFGSNRLRLEAHHLADRLREINRAGVEISRQAAGERARVFASIGPSGKLLAAGETTTDELRGVFDQQAAALAEGKPDGLVVETMSDLEEALLAVASARATGLPVVACMVFDSGKQLDRTLTGVTPEQAAQALTESGADAIGANCGQGAAGFLSVCRRMREVTNRPLWMKPNAGLPELVDGEVVYRTTPAAFAADAAALRQCGATFIGGCCGTNPDFIRALAEALRA
jgi:methionine synthase I (cobalamin-dependent)